MVNIGTYMLPVICGLLIQVSASMLEVSETVGEASGVRPRHCSGSVSRSSLGSA